MKIKITALLLTMVMLLTLLPGCGMTEQEDVIVATTEVPEMMVPKVAYLNFLEEGDNPAWQFVWNFHWNEEGYLTKIEGEKRINGDTAYLTQYYIEKENEWYGTLGFYPLPVQAYDDSYFYHLTNAIPRECYRTVWSEFRSESFGKNHTYLCTKITAGARDYQNPERMYSDIPDGYSVQEWEIPMWLYADFTYDEYGNAVRIDTYNLKKELCGFTEIEWIPLEQIIESEETIAENQTVSIMVPKVAYLNYVEENGGPEWQYIWEFEWDEHGYLTAVYGDQIVNGNVWETAMYYVKENDGWYDSGWLSHGSFEELYPKYKDGPKPHDPGEWEYALWGECTDELGWNRTSIGVSITANTRDYLSPERIYNDIPDDYSYGEYDVREWLYAEYTYDEHGNAIRIDTYNLEGELSGYTEIEWMEIEIKS